jgi:hypothetical protein
MDGHVPLSMQARNVGPLVQSLEHLRNIEMDCTADPLTMVAERRRILTNPDGIPGANLRSQLHNLQRLPAVAAYDEAGCAEVLSSMTSTIQVPTLRLNALSVRPPFQRSDWDALLETLPVDVEADWRATTEARRAAEPTQPTTYADWSLFLVRLMHEAGVPIGAGTDTPISFAAPGYSLHSELEMLVEEGRLADLVLLARDPLDDIANTRSVQAVVSKGKLLNREELDRLVR